MSRPEVSLIAPCLNEQDNVRELTERFLNAAICNSIEVEIVLIDDGSTDLTWEIIQELETEFPGRIISVRHSANRGIPNGWLSGVEASTGEHCCLIDSDLQNPPESVFDLLTELKRRDVSLVRGVRRPVKAQSKSRVAMSRSLNFLLNFVFGMNSKDNKSGYLLGRTEEIKRIVHHTGHYRHYQTFIGVAAHSFGIPTAEIDTAFEDRRNGISFLSGRSFSVIREVFADIPEAHREFGSRFRPRRDK
jgi:phenylacetate-CoA ligase